MKEAAFAERVINNFYLRNTIVLLVLLSASIARKVHMAGGFDCMGFLYSCIVFTILYAVIVLHNTILFKRLFKKGYYIIYVVSVLAIWFFYNEWILMPLKNLFGIRDTMPMTWKDTLLLVYGYVVYMYIGLGLYLGFNYFKERENSLRLAYLQRELELQQLKEQLHPHFLFNALNNIYSYSIENSARANELILKLSELMRFTIGHAAKDSIAIDEEIQFIRHYIALEQERLGKRCRVSFVTDVDSGDTPVAPFILFTLVENAFKHGTVTVQESSIDISLSVSAGRIRLSITNPLHRSVRYSTKTGLANVRRRLSIIYGQAYSLKLAEDGEVFKTELLIG